MIAVTGAAGRLGVKVATRLAKLGVKQRLIVRDPARAPNLSGAEVACASSYGDAIAMGQALKGVETLFLISARDRFGIMLMSALKKETPPPYDRLQQHVTAIDVAAAVGVKRIVYLSAINAAADATFILSKDHYYTEEHIRTIGVPFTSLRMSLYTDHVPLDLTPENSNTLTIHTYLDRRNQIMASQDLFTSLMDTSTAVHPREVIEHAIKNEATYLVFVHNHPSGDPNPSRSDREITRDLIYVGMIMQIRVLDHIIIGENRFFSFAGEGLIEKFENDYLRLKIRGVPGSS